MFGKEDKFKITVFMIERILDKKDEFETLDEFYTYINDIEGDFETEENFYKINKQHPIRKFSKCVYIKNKGYYLYICKITKDIYSFNLDLEKSKEYKEELFKMLKGFTKIDFIGHNCMIKMNKLGLLNETRYLDFINKYGIEDKNHGYFFRMFFFKKYIY
jgi:hypothetical protein